MTVSEKRKICLYISFALFAAVIVFFAVVSLVSSRGYEAWKNAANAERISQVFEEQKTSRLTIIIDPGHGGEDPGAVSGTLREKDINLAVSLKLAEFASLENADIVMTRDSDILLYKPGQENRKKFYDLRNRLDFSLKYDKCIFVSIHVNKFPIEKYSGLQVFYSKNDEGSKALAEAIQSSSRILTPENDRQVKLARDIYILDNIKVPAVIVECGFISNAADADRLTDESFTDSLACCIYAGIAEYLGGVDEN